MILGSRIYDELDTSRFMCITGVLSGGKTRLAFDLAVPYWRRGMTVNANVTHNFSGDNRPAWQHDMLYDTFNIADEGGEYVRKAATASTLVRSAGKANYYFIFSGKRLPHNSLQELIVMPRFDFYANYGLPFILWRCTVHGAKKYDVHFWQFLPQLIHGTYSTRTSTSDIDVLIRMAENTVKHLAATEGQEAGQQRTAGLDGLADDLSTLGEAAGLS